MMAEPPAHRLTLRVYCEDTDFSGVVYHANYLRFLERGRTEFLRDLGINQADLHGGGAGPPLGFAVTRMSIGFLKPARMDDLLRVETRRMKLGGASVRLDQAIWRGPDRLVEADVTVAFLSAGRVVAHAVRSQTPARRLRRSADAAHPGALR